MRWQGVHDFYPANQITDAPGTPGTKNVGGKGGEQDNDEKICVHEFDACISEYLDGLYVSGNV